MMKQKQRLASNGFSKGCRFSALCALFSRLKFLVKYGLSTGRKVSVRHNLFAERKFSARHGLLTVLVLFIVGLLGIAMFLTSCDLFTGDDIEISPPDWIIGEWTDAEGNISFNFTDDNIIQNASDIIVNYKTVLKLKPDAFFEMLSNAQEYAFSFTDSGASVNYHFVKTSADTLDFYFLGTKLELKMQENP
ncbi:MAG: hypothetical protein K9K78_06570 [Spirochaetales bacterium]|nr:hypothetical protein [Spirochaetales bacterium]